MGQPVSKSDIANARALCFDVLAQTEYAVSAEWIATWHGGGIASRRAIQCALRSMFINGHVDRRRSGRDGYVYTLVPDGAAART